MIKKNEGIIMSIMGFFQGGGEIMPIRLANYLKENHYRVAIHCVKKNGNEKK